MDPSRRWRELLDERLAEAVAELGRVQGVRGLIVGGSLGRGDPWPLSDIDLVPIYADSAGSPDPAREVGRRQALLADADPQTLARRADLAPAWLRERIDLAAGARRLIGEDVTPAQNARDQLLAFATHVARHRPDQAGPWMVGEPEPDLPASLARLDRLMAEVARCLPELNEAPAEGGG
jgi:hypothetical protein